MLAPPWKRSSLLAQILLHYLCLAWKWILSLNRSLFHGCSKKFHFLGSSVYGPTSDTATVYFDNTQESLSRPTKIKAKVGYCHIQTLKRKVLFDKSVPKSKCNSHVIRGSCGSCSNHMLKLPFLCVHYCGVTDAVYRNNRSCEEKSSYVSNRGAASCGTDIDNVLW